MEVLSLMAALGIALGVPCAVLLVIWAAPTPGRRGVAALALIVPLAPFLLAAVIINERHVDPGRRRRRLERAVVTEWSIGLGYLGVAWIEANVASSSTVALAEAEVPAEVAIATVLAARPHALIVIPARADAASLSRQFPSARIAPLTAEWSVAAAEADRLSRTAVGQH
jgi:hypothetical protein